MARREANKTALAKFHSLNKCSSNSEESHPKGDKNYQV
ncbi:uncharacterized protein G2W53_015685 [Senna tora]|uniref:Uncharacterized protein n=1 Tax=Senna tora TaxID=362788 RepID=A0A834WW68_9FABA|nr:uncharacterized protein G2W53_015685 [Senna tora]